MTRKVWTGVALSCLLLSSPAWRDGCRLQAQTTEQVTLSTDDLWHGRAFLLALRGQGIVDESGWWGADSGLRQYAKAHPDESFLLFAQSGVLYRLDRPAELQRLAEIHDPLEMLGDLQAALGRSMTPLGDLQVQLGHSMGPLSEEQGSLSQQMQAASGPRAMSRIGREMGIVGHQQGVIGRQQGVVGREQGVIGRQQGVIGREQGRLGRAFYQSTQRVIDKCLAEKTCTAVAPVAPATAQR